MKKPSTTPGPELSPLLHWLTNCPEEFLMPPQVLCRDNSFTGIIHTGSVISDLLGLLTHTPLTVAEAQVFILPNSKEAINRLRLILLCCYLFSHSWFRDAITHLGTPRQWLYHFFKDGLTALSAEATAESFVTDPERREELARLCLKALNLRPAGETELQAIDRLTTVDSVERKKVMRESLAAHTRAEEIRQAMARKEAEEAASKMTRE